MAILNWDFTEFLIESKLNGFCGVFLLHLNLEIFIGILIESKLTLLSVL